MAYQPLLVIQCQSHSPRRTELVLFNPWLGGQGGSYLSPKSICPESEHNSATGVQTRLLRSHSPSLLTITLQGHPAKIYCYIN